MKSVNFSKTKPKAPLPPAVGDEVLTFVKIGTADGHPVPDLMERLAAFYAKYPRRPLTKGEKTAAELVREARDRR